MKIKKLALKLCKIEGLKKQVNIAQMSEIVGALSDILYEELGAILIPENRTYSELLDNGYKRMLKKEKAVAKCNKK